MCDSVKTIRQIETEGRGGDAPAVPACPSPGSSSLWPPGAALRLSGRTGLGLNVGQGTAWHGPAPGKNPLSRAGGSLCPGSARRPQVCRAVPGRAVPCRAEPGRVGPDRAVVGPFSIWTAVRGREGGPGVLGAARARGGLGRPQPFPYRPSQGPILWGWGAPPRGDSSGGVWGGAGPALSPEKCSPGPGEEWGARWGGQVSDGGPGGEGGRGAHRGGRGVHGPPPPRSDVLGG